MGVGFQVCKTKSSEEDGGDSLTTTGKYLVPLNYTLKHD